MKRLFLFLGILGLFAACRDKTAEKLAIDAAKADIEFYGYYHKKDQQARKFTRVGSEYSTYNAIQSKFEAMASGIIKKIDLQIQEKTFDFPSLFNEYNDLVRKSDQLKDSLKPLKLFLLDDLEAIGFKKIQFGDSLMNYPEFAAHYFKKQVFKSLLITGSNMYLAGCNFGASAKMTAAEVFSYNLFYHEKNRQLIFTPNWPKLYDSYARTEFYDFSILNGGKRTPIEKQRYSYKIKANELQVIYSDLPNGNYILQFKTLFLKPNGSSDTILQEAQFASSFQILENIKHRRH